MTEDLSAALAAITEARRRLRGRPVRSVAAALAAAAARWRHDAQVRTALADATALSPAMLEAVLPLVADAIDADALVELHAREGAADGPALIAHVLASNVPALGVPAIALSCLAGAAVVAKSGRADRVSAPAFARAVADVDPELGATILAAYWPRDAPETEAVLAAADVVTATGGDDAVARVARRMRPRVVAYGARTSVAVVTGGASDEEVAALALDVARYEQRGCLSPTTVFVAGDAPAFARRLLAALDALAIDLPLPVSAAARGSRRLALETARFAGATVLDGRGGAALLDVAPGTVDEALQGRTVAVHPITRGDEVVAALPVGRIECIGAGAGVTLDPDALRRRGVSRLCPLGRMQRPGIDWPRGQQPALGSLFRGGDEPRIQVET